MSNPPSEKRPIGERRLAAIMFTDVVSFSKRMGENEALTLRLVRRDFEAITEACTSNGGQVLKTTGDGLLMSFPTAGAAVQCAMKVQKTVANAQKTLPPEQVLQHRIGIHLGDVFVGEGDVMGNDVNIAARVLSEAGGGEICVSQTVYDVVKNRLSVKAIYLGQRELKNIRDPVTIFKLPTFGDDGAELKTSPSPIQSPSPQGRVPEAPPGARPAASKKGLFAITLLTLAIGAGITLWETKFRNSTQALAPQSSTEPTTEQTIPGTAKFVDTLDRAGNWKGMFGDTAVLVFGDFPSALPAEPMKVHLKDSPEPVEISFTGCRLAAPPQQRTDLMDPVRLTSGDRSPFRLVGIDFNIRMRFPDDKVRRLTFYCHHRQDPNHTQTIVITDATSNSELARKQVVKFGDGIYVSFDVSGVIDVHFRPGAASKVAGTSAMFIDPVPAAK